LFSVLVVHKPDQHFATPVVFFDLAELLYLFDMCQKRVASELPVWALTQRRAPHAELDQNSPKNSQPHLCSFSTKSVNPDVIVDIQYCIVSVQSR
jgi:hypothetical protein